MSIATLMVLNEISSATLGLSMLLVPAWLSGFLGAVATPYAEFLMRLYGAILVANTVFMIGPRRSSDLLR